MNRASPIEIRKALELANTLARAGVLFVAIPLLDEKDKADLGWLIERQMDRLEKEVGHAN